MSTKLNLNLLHCKINPDSEEFAGKIEKIRKVPVPNFAKYEPDLDALKKLRTKYADKKNIIVEGNGGAISNFRGIFGALGGTSGKNVYLLDTEDPDYIQELREKCGKSDTLIILTSKSGTRIQVLANYFALRDYPILVITADNDGTLNLIRKAKNMDVSFYPKVEMTDRYTGVTESALTSAEIVGIDTRDIVLGAKDMHAQCGPQAEYAGNLALRLAVILDKLEKSDYNEMFLSIYSKKLANFFELITQLFHESVCKNGMGQTIYGGEAPENQHHTLQRFMAGRKNSVGLFVTVKYFNNTDLKIEVENGLRNVPCRNITLEQLENVTLEKIIKTEFDGTWQDIVENKIPAAHLELENISPYSIGEFMAFMHYASFYSALLRGVNPCDQPGVEKSKEYMFEILGKS